MVQLKCPRCSAQIEAQPGQQASCPNCGFSAVVPGEPAPAAVPAAPQPWTPSPAEGPAPGAPGPAPYGPPVRPFGGFWIRFVAYFLDGLVLFVPNLVILILLVPGGAAGLVDPETEFTPQEGIANVITLVLSWLYFALMESSRLQASLGKLAVGLKVTTLSGRRISFARATGRYFAQILSAIILLIGFFMIGWTRYKQGLHDKIAGTLVYKKAFMPQQPLPPGPVQPAAPGPA